MSNMYVDTIRKTGGSLGTDIRIKNTSVYESDGGTSVTQNLVQGLAKQWGHFDQKGSTLGANTSGDTFNTTSFTDVEAGHVDVAIANDMSNATYSVNATTHFDGTIANDRFSRFVGASGIATGSFRLAGQWENNNPEDVYFHGILVHGDLA